MAGEHPDVAGAPEPAPGPAPALLQVRGLNQAYGGSHILRDVSFEAHAGEVTVVLGRNGVGKTTLLKSLMGVVPVRSGSVVLGGRDLTRSASYERARGHRLRAPGTGYHPTSDG